MTYNVSSVMLFTLQLFGDLFRLCLLNARVCNTLKKSVYLFISCCVVTVTYC